jgi:hypothetical protein
MPAWQRRAASAEVNGRRVNEAIERGTNRMSAGVFVCECGHVGCNATLELSIADYEAARSDFDRFVLVPGHEIEAIDCVVERHAGYLIVVKRGAAPRAIAREEDPRRGSV